MTWTEKGADDKYSEILIRAVHERLPTIAEHLEGSGYAAGVTNVQWKRSSVSLSIYADFSSGDMTAVLNGPGGGMSYNADGEAEIWVESDDLAQEGEVRFPTGHEFSDDAFVKAAGELARRLCEPDAARVLERFFRQQSDAVEAPPTKGEP
jgi:hypothetical protein